MITPKSSRFKSFSAQVSKHNFIYLFVHYSAAVDKFESGVFQTIAVMGKNLLQIDIGLCLAYPDVLISALIGLNAEMNPNETILLTAEQASWLGVCCAI